MNFPKKVFGSILIVLSALGLLVSLFALVTVWRLRQPVVDQILESLDTAEKIVNTSASGLDVIDASLDNVRNSLTALEESTMSMARSVDDTSKVISAFSDLFKGDLKDTLENTKISVIAAQSSALIIDNLLYGLSKIPILGIVYDPPKPLNSALKEIGDTLKDMPDSMEDISGTLTDSNDQLKFLKDGIDEIAGSFAGFQQDLNAAQAVVNDYQNNLREIKASIDNTQENINRWSIWWAIGLSLLILLIGVSQVAAILQGVEMINYPRSLERLIEKKIREINAANTEQQP